MLNTIAIQRLSVTLIFDLEDRYTRERQIGETHPRPTGPVRVLLVGRVDNGLRTDFAHPLELQVRTSPSGYLLFFGHVKQSDGTYRRAGLTAGTYVVRIESQRYQPVERADIALPQPDAAYFFDLPPGYAYLFPTAGRSRPTLLRGSLHTTDGQGIANALIEGAGQPEITYRTDASGQWVLAFPPNQPAGAVSIQITFPDQTIRTVTAQVLPGTETSLAQTALRGTVLGAGGVGIRGATVGVAGRLGQTCTDSNGGWFYYFDLNQPATQVRLIATLPDGRQLELDNVLVQPGATVRVPVFRFT